MRSYSRLQLLMRTASSSHILRQRCHTNAVLVSWQLSDEDLVSLLYTLSIESMTMEANSTCTSKTHAHHIKSEIDLPLGTGIPRPSLVVAGTVVNAIEATNFRTQVNAWSQGKHGLQINGPKCIRLRRAGSAVESRTITVPCFLDASTRYLGKGCGFGGSITVSTRRRFLYVPSA